MQIYISKNLIFLSKIYWVNKQRKSKENTPRMKGKIPSGVTNLLCRIMNYGQIIIPYTGAYLEQQINYFATTFPNCK